MKVIGHSVSFVAIIFMSTLWSGYALSVLWSWFVAGTFGLPQLTINAAIGLAIIVGYMTRTVDNEKSDRSATEVLVRCAIIGTLKPAFALGTGWIVRLFA